MRWGDALELGNPTGVLHRSEIFFHTDSKSFHTPKNLAISKAKRKSYISTQPDRIIKINHVLHRPSLLLFLQSALAKTLHRSFRVFCRCIRIGDCFGDVRPKNGERRIRSETHIDAFEEGARRNRRRHFRPHGVFVVSQKRCCFFVSVSPDLILSLQIVETSIHVL